MDNVDQNVDYNRKRAHKKLNFATRLVIITSCLLMAGNVLLGVVLYYQSKNALRTIIEERMLDISNTAASMLDGDYMRDIQPEDIGTEEYERQLGILRKFQDNIDLEYIYGIRQEKDGTFIFTIDPAPDDPGEFGEPIVSTDALVSASKGTAAVDKEPYTDDWGRFYSAYTPFFDSEGNVSGIVAVDFSAAWFEEQLRKNTYFILFGSLVSMFVGALIVFLVTGRLRRRFKTLVSEVGTLAEDLNGLTDEAWNGHEGTKLLQMDDVNSVEKLEEMSNDEIDRVKYQIGKMHNKLKRYLAFVQQQAHMDAMTGVSNKTAYLDIMHRIEREIREGKADFSVVVFDINGLKKINDNYGHEQGDRVIICAADSLRRAFGDDNVYRIGGDEFIAVLPGESDEKVSERYVELDKAIEEVNHLEPPLVMPLTISKGTAAFNPEEDKEYNAVFKRADEAMYKDKARYYMENGDRRRRRE